MTSFVDFKTLGKELCRSIQGLSLTIAMSGDAQKRVCNSTPMSVRFTASVQKRAHDAL